MLHRAYHPCGHPIAWEVWPCSGDRNYRFASTFYDAEAPEPRRAIAACPGCGERLHAGDLSRDRPKAPEPGESDA